MVVMKIVITGALGHIGSRLIRVLPERFPDATFILLDNLSTQRYASLFHLPSAHYHFLQVDLCNCSLEQTIGLADCVIHLAAMTDAANSFERKEALFDNNLTMTQRLAEYCNTMNIPLIFPSSTSVYGSQDNRVDEHCAVEVLQPQSPYADCKIQEETLLQTYATAGLPVVILRLGTIFGPSPGMRFHTAVNKFCWQAAMGQKITVWRTAYQQNRPYLSLTDAVNAIAFIIQHQLYDGEIYNVLTANHTVQDVIEVIRCFVPDLELAFVDAKIMNQLSYEVVNTKLIQQGFVYQDHLLAGIEATFQWLGQAGPSVRKVA